MSSSWELVETTGLLDKADIEITGAEFNYDAGYADGEQLLLILNGTSNQEGWEEFTQFLSIGRGWDSPDNGATVEGNDNFTNNSQYGLFIQGAVDAGAGNILKDRGFPDKASIWVGLRFHVERVEHDYGDLGTKQVLVPTAFLGEATAVAPKAEAPVEVAGAAPASDGSDAVLRAKILALRSAPNHDAFIEEVITKYPEVQQHTDLFAEVVDPDGIYVS